MKADAKTNRDVNAVLKAMFAAYKKRDLQGMLAFVDADSDVVIIGSGEDERAHGAQEFGKSISQDWVQSESSSVDFNDAEVSMAGSVAWFAADVTFAYTVAGQKTEMLGRLTGVLEKKENIWLVIQLHFSVPACQQEHER